VCDVPALAPVPISDAPKFRCFSSQLVSDWQFAESPPKLYPTYGVTNPSALAGAAAAASAATTNATILVYRTESSTAMIARRYRYRCAFCLAVCRCSR